MSLVNPSNPPPYLSVSPFDYIVEGIFPAGEVNLLVGAPGCGKTTLLLQMLETWRKGETWFGHVSHPAPFVYISADRSRNGVLRTLHRMNLEEKNLPFFSAVSEGLAASTIEIIINKALTRFPGTRVLFIEGFSSKVPRGKINDYDVVCKYLSNLTCFCGNRGLTIFGVVHTSKSKEGEGYANPRERTMGSNAWTAFSETFVLVEWTHPGSRDIEKRRLRNVYIFPHNGPEEIYEMSFTGGLLKPRGEQPDHDTRFAAWLKGRASSVSFTLLDAFRAFPGIAPRTVQRWIAKALETKVLERRKKGEYAITQPDLLALNIDNSPTYDDADDLE